VASTIDRAAHPRFWVGPTAEPGTRNRRSRGISVQEALAAGVELVAAAEPEEVEPDEELDDEESPELVVESDLVESFFSDFSEEELVEALEPDRLSVR
jgi:hypothetical protein